MSFGLPTLISTWKLYCGGRAKLYRLNEKSHLVMLLKNIEITLIKEAADVEEEEAEMKVKVRARK
ncbi:Uncharacterised protein [uncultured archaeon]|nr:Uncharacterised protein [uncultured archaeon]